MAEDSSYVLFNPGPVNLDERIKQTLFDRELCHRQPEFEALMASVVQRLLVTADLSETGHRVSLLHGSGSLAVDAALTTFVRGRVLVVDNGVYCRRLARTLAAVPGAEVAVHDAGVGQRVELEALDADASRLGPTWIAAVHHETTTGLLNPLGQIADIAKRHGARLFVDAVSSFGAHQLDPRADVVCFNSNKCLESLPGIAGVFWRSDLSAHPTVPVLDVTTYADKIPSTPHVQAFIALDIALDLLAQEDRPARYARLAKSMWDSASGRFEPLLEEPDRSYVLTAFRLGGRNPDRLLERAAARGYVIYAGQGKLREEIFRVANMGAVINEALLEDLFETLAA